MGQCRYIDSSGNCLVNPSTCQCLGNEDQRKSKMVCGLAILFQNERVQLRRDLQDFEQFLVRFWNDISSVKVTILVYETWVRSRARDGIVTGISYHNWLEIQKNHGRIIEGSGDYSGHLIFNI